MDYDELVRRLRSRPFTYDHDGMELADQGVEFEAADAIVALQARVAELEQLLTHTGLLAAQEEHNAMRHDIGRYVTIAAKQAQEIEALRHDLAAARAERKEIWWLPWEPQEVARRFHLAYEHFAPDFGYETRPDTKVFDPYSANGQLMIAVVRNVLIEQASSKGVDELNATRADLAAARVLLKQANEMLAEAIVCGPKLREYMPLRQRIVAALHKGEK